MSRPLLFLDVDGPLNPYAAQRERRPAGYTTIRVALRPGRPLRVWLHPDHGRALLALGYDLCWATSWMDAANRWIGPVIGLPELPYVDFTGALFTERPDGVHWKTQRIVAYAEGRPFARAATMDEAYEVLLESPPVRAAARRDRRRRVAHP
ncbi:hypothetical protein ABZV29_41315 [Streptomyces sp. NPDC005236]|uniref:hypothetical protein n=1 Tax=Streptomyces sp. NPDC005236 TaxID=3157028 RepID=UPI0033AB9775